MLFIHTTLVPKVPGSNELKTKPTQHSFKQLMSQGIKANIIVVRSSETISEEIKNKISLFCDVPKNAIVQSENVDVIYEVPVKLHEQGLDDYVIEKLQLKAKKSDSNWANMLRSVKDAKETLEVGLIGKYVKLHDAYLSVSQALIDASYKNGYKLNIHWINSQEITEENVSEKLSGLDGIIVPGGFGSRGVEGMITTSKYSRENNIPYFGICFGMQIAIIDIARNVCKLEGADSTEKNEYTKYPVISLMEDQFDVKNIGGTLRLGNYDCKLKENTKARKLYNEEFIKERHRHRYEFNNKFRKELEQAGVVFSGINPELDLVEIIEYNNSDYFVACQFHPEFKSRPNKVHPLFDGFIKASIKNKKSK